MASEHDIIVVDDHPLFRRGVIQLLKMDPSFNVVAPVFNTRTARRGH